MPREEAVSVPFMIKKKSHMWRSGWGMAEPGYCKEASKVVSIPVRFVGSERSRTVSAIKIQRVLRGFLVRNSLRKMGATRVELERIEREQVMMWEQKERLRVCETIMNLLLKLDSVRVLHYPGLRECRKSLINKAISLQEMLDPHSDGQGNSCLLKVKEEDLGQCLREDEDGIETLRNWGLDNEEESGLGPSLVQEKEGEITCEEVKEEASEERRVLVEENYLLKEKEGEGKKGELLEKMLVMMEQLFQRNEMQTILLTSLSQRVEQLERAISCDKLRKKKKKKNAHAKNKHSDTKNGFI
ncbi:hypothetical protein VNO78_14782 [Psophocarpus tetragonolobus]|uniref:BAG domain-containing protein n=1 Tax=Psophocarpus tetragonolobus TaxID=3891 RepID=A0AAN9XJ11_PSOTE